MKVQISNWGPIENCEFDLDKNLLVIYGDNNIGKSYAMQVLYLVLKRLLDAIESPAYTWMFRDPEWPTGIEDWIKEFSENQEVRETEITQRIVSAYEQQLSEEVLPAIVESFYNTFGTYDNILTAKPAITLHREDEFIFQILPADERIQLKLSTKPIFLKKTESNFHKSRDSKSRLDIYIYNAHEIQAPVQLIRRQIFMVSTLVCNEILSITHNVYFLPASRSGIYTGMNAFGPIMAQLSKNRNAIRGTIQIPSIPETITNYYVELSSIRSDAKGRFTEIAQQIEETILNGKVEFDNKKKTLTYREREEDYAMEMSDVSSMVSEISPITAYLKYIVEDTSKRRRRIPQESATAQSILFIEEPEAHLHPENQVKLIKIFSELAKKNIKLVLASHSNYIFNELNNLVLGGELDHTIYEPILMKRIGGKSNTVPMQMDEFGVDDENFADVADGLVEERDRLIQEIVDNLQKGKNDTEN